MLHSASTQPWWRAKYYRLTASGRRQLAIEASAWERVWAPTSCRILRRRHGDAFDEPPQCERNLERRHRQPHQLSDGAAQDAYELQGKAHHEQD